MSKNKKNNYFILLLLVFTIVAISLSMLIICLTNKNENHSESNTTCSYESEEKQANIVIIHTNDVHGRVDENMGYASVMTLKKLYEEKGFTVLTLDAGDTFVEKDAAETKGENIALIMNYIGYDAMAPGNNDFNYGLTQLQRLNDMTAFPILCANLKNKNDASMPFESYVVIEKNNIKFGIFGLTTTDTSNPDGYKFTNCIKAAMKCVSELEELSVDYIICISHLGVESSEYTSEMIAKSVAGIDVIIDGHSHTVLTEGLMSNDTLIASTGKYLQNIGVVTIGEKISAKLYNSDSLIKKDNDITEYIKRLD